MTDLDSDVISLVRCSTCSNRPEKILYDSFSYLYCRNCKNEVICPKEVYYFPQECIDFYNNIIEDKMDNIGVFYEDIDLLVYKSLKERKKKKRISANLGGGAYDSRLGFKIFNPSFFATIIN